MLNLKTTHLNSIDHVTYEMYLLSNSSYDYQNMLDFKITHNNSYATLNRSRDPFRYIPLVITHCFM